MSWDVVVLRLPGHVQTVDDLPDDWPPEPLGPPRQVLGRLCATFPRIQPCGPAGAMLLGTGWTVEFRLGEDDPVVCVTLHARGGEHVVEVAHRAAGALDSRVLDLSTGRLLAPGEAGSHPDWWIFAQTPGVDPFS